MIETSYRLDFDFDNGIMTSSYSSKGCGKKVATCIQKAHTDHGWWSVGLSVFTAFQPEVILGTTWVCTVISAFLNFFLSF